MTTPHWQSYHPKSMDSWMKSETLATPRELEFVDLAFALYATVMRESHAQTRVVPGREMNHMLGVCVFASVVAAGNKWPDYLKDRLQDEWDIDLRGVKRTLIHKVGKIAFASIWERRNISLTPSQTLEALVMADEHNVRYVEHERPAFIPDTQIGFAIPDQEESSVKQDG